MSKEQPKNGPWVFRIKLGRFSKFQTWVLLAGEVEHLVPMHLFQILDGREVALEKQWSKAAVEDHVFKQFSGSFKLNVKSQADSL